VKQTTRACGAYGVELQLYNLQEHGLGFVVYMASKKKKTDNLYLKSDSSSSSFFFNFIPFSIIGWHYTLSLPLKHKQGRII